MSNVTLDTTVLIKGIIPPGRIKKDSIYEEQFKLHITARSIIHKIEINESVMNVTSTALIEVAAVAARLTGKEDRGILASDYVRKHGNVVGDIYLPDESISIAAKTKISGFDSVFIACAKITASTLITDDKQMYEAAVKIGINAQLLRDIK
ncbi:MAG: hypothetical protein CVT89_03790 [Candidatus Altiarchaeales archaeon HGW-Altiarchaeales-2]|nr:MAG: hypothetical protein CVT89_03790 [Candidatus Altiarchaeales archaeon HGW-Altiarchaeales-2]